jgi:hypothetical protein
MIWYSSNANVKTARPANRWFETRQPQQEKVDLSLLQSG